MIEYSKCKWCGERIEFHGGGRGWVHESNGGGWCEVTEATPPDGYGRCTECNHYDWRKCGCTSIVAQIEGKTFTDEQRRTWINEEKQSGR